MGASHTYRYISVPAKPTTAFTYDTLHSGAHAATQEYTVTTTKDYTLVIISSGGYSSTPTYTYTGSGVLVVNKVTGTGAASTSYTSYKVYVSIYYNVKAGDTFKVDHSNPGMGSAMIGIY